MDEKTKKSLEFHRSELLEAVAMDFVTRSNKSYRAFNFARQVPDAADRRPVYESLWDAAIIMRYANPRGYRWNNWTDRICQLRFSICENEEEYRKLVALWWQFARPTDKKVRREKNRHYMSAEEENQVTSESIEKVFGEMAAATYALTQDLDIVIKDNKHEYHEEYNKRRESMRWRWTGGEILSYDYWLRAHIENARANIYESNLSLWFRSVHAAKFYEPVVAE
jgi:hypothetical protein